MIIPWKKIKPYSFMIMVAAYLLAGLYHFIHPEFYLEFIPPYLPNPDLLNILAGVAEISLALFLIPKSTRYFAAVGIILMLIAFIPAHIHMIVLDGKIPNGPELPLWAAWVRLIVLHPMLMYWAWWHRH